MHLDGVPRRLAGEDRDHQRGPAARRRRGHQRLARRRARRSVPKGGEGLKIGVTPDAGPGYVLNADGSSCYGSTGGEYNALADRHRRGAGKTDTPAFPAVGEPAFGTLDGTTTSMFAPVAGLLRALDVVAPDYQKGGQDFIAGWNAEQRPVRARASRRSTTTCRSSPARRSATSPARRPSRRSSPGRPRNDLEAYNAAGAPASPAWPKLTGGWIVATPMLGSLGTRRHELDAKKDVVSITREGTVVGVLDAGVRVLAELVAELPPRHRQLGRLHARRDPAGRAAERERRRKSPALDGAGRGPAVRHGERATKSSPPPARSRRELRERDAARRRATPAAAGTAQSYTLPGGVERYVAIRAVDDQGNVGLPESVRY